MADSIVNKRSRIARSWVLGFSAAEGQDYSTGCAKKQRPVLKGAETLRFAADKPCPKCINSTLHTSPNTSPPPFHSESRLYRLLQN